MLLWFTGPLILLQVKSEMCAVRNSCNWTQAKPQDIVIEMHLAVCAVELLRG